MRVEIELSKWQKRVFRNRKRFTVISAGRQSGKTFLCVFLIILFALTRKRSISWWVAPTYDPARMAFRRCINFLIDNKIPHDANRSELRITLPFNGSVIQFRSADREDGLRGETVDFIVIDEMGLLKRDAWEYALRGTITATNADAVFIGTPKGKNLFYELFVRGQDPADTEHASFNVESRESPYFSEREWAEVQRLPQRVFEQEYRAQFIDDGGEVFRGVRECVRGQLEPIRHGKKTYYCGVDLAKSMDYTVICILDNHGHLCHFDRFNDISWSVQKSRIVDACRKYDAYALLDSTGLGDPILDDLSPHIRVDGYKFNNTSKRQLVESLIMAIERQEISYPDIPELINEMSTFTFEQTDGGVIKYHAPDGMHDDIVIALALANWACGKSRGGFGMIDFEDGREAIEAW